MRWLALGVCVALAGTARADTGDAERARIEAARRAVLGDDYQSELPGGSGASAGDGSGVAPARPREREIRYVDGKRREYVDTRVDDEPTTGGAVLARLLWGVVIAAVIVLVAWFAVEVSRGGGGDAAIAPDEAAPAAPDLAVIERPLGDAEELARRGEFREAIHTLLLRTLHELARTAQVTLRPAMTSREILARMPLSPEARAALRGLIAAVELTHFGGDDATADDYARCRAQFQVFAAAFRGRA